jgi:hypothetical protein
MKMITVGTKMHATTIASTTTTSVNWRREIEKNDMIVTTVASQKKVHVNKRGHFEGEFTKDVGSQGTNK